MDKPWEIQYISPLDREYHSAYFEDQENCTYMAILLEKYGIKHLVYKERVDIDRGLTFADSYSFKKGQFGMMLAKD